MQKLDVALFNRSANTLLFVFSRARGLLWVHHRVVDRPDVELRGVDVRGEGAVGASHREPDLCQPAVLRERQEQGSSMLPNPTSSKRARRLPSNRSVFRHPTVVPLHLHSSFHTPPASLPSLTLPSPRPHPLQAVTCGRLSDRCSAVWGGSLIRTDRHQR